MENKKKTKKKQRNKKKNRKKRQMKREERETSCDNDEEKQPTKQPWSYHIKDERGKELEFKLKKIHEIFFPCQKQNRWDEGQRPRKGKL